MVSGIVRFIGSMIVAGLASGCATPPRERLPLPLSYEAQITSEGRSKLYDGIRDSLNLELITPGKCDKVLDDILTDVNFMTYIDSNTLLSDNPDQDIQDLWLLRQLVQDKLKDQYNDGIWPDSCLEKTKEILNDIRLYEDQVVERWELDKGTLAAKGPFQGDFPYVLMPQNSTLANIVDELRTGDVILRTTIEFYSGIMKNLATS